MGKEKGSGGINQKMVRRRNQQRGREVRLVCTM